MRNPIITVPSEPICLHLYLLTSKCGLYEPAALVMPILKKKIGNCVRYTLYAIRLNTVNPLQHKKRPKAPKKKRQWKSVTFNRNCCKSFGVLPLEERSYLIKAAGLWPESDLIWRDYCEFHSLNKQNHNSTPNTSINSPDCLVKAILSQAPGVWVSQNEGGNVVSHMSFLQPPGDTAGSYTVCARGRVWPKGWI